jgi:hypothetical protein
MMILLNFQGPGSTTKTLVECVSESLGRTIDTVSVRELNLSVTLHDVRATDVLTQIFRNTGLSPHVLLEEPLVVMLPRHPLVSVLVMSALYGFTGRWPSVVNLTVQQNQPPEFAGLVRTSEFVLEAGSVEK